MSIYAGIVLYNPDILRLQQSLERLEGQVDGIVLVDNASKNVNELDSLIEKNSNVKIIKNDDNLGIATALNQICNYALDENAEWVLTLDQDTVCENSMVSQLIKYSSIDRVGILCPDVDYEGLDIYTPKNGSELTQIRACMTSGSLTNVQAWKTVGGFRDDYFIDFVDNEFCMNLEKNHYKVLRVNNCIMHHQLGEAQVKRYLFIFKYKVSTHNPWRYYYMTRNNLVFIWDNRACLNIVKEYLKLAKILFQGLLFSNEKKLTLSYIRKGYFDAKYKRMGKFSDC